MRFLGIRHTWRLIITEDINYITRGLYGSHNQTQRLLPAGVLMMWDLALVLCGPEGNAAHMWGDSIHLLNDFTSAQWDSNILNLANHNITLGTQETVCLS